MITFCKSSELQINTAAAAPILKMHCIAARSQNSETQIFSSWRNPAKMIRNHNLWSLRYVDIDDGDNDNDGVSAITLVRWCAKNPIGKNLSLHHGRLDYTPLMIWCQPFCIWWGCNDDDIVDAKTSYNTSHNHPQYVI